MATTLLLEQMLALPIDILSSCGLREDKSQQRVLYMEWD